MGVEDAFRLAVAELDRDPRVAAGTGFGGAPGRRVNGRIFAMLYHGALVVKLPAARVTALIGSGVAGSFDAGKGKPMREWATVPVDRAEEWSSLAAEASAFVAGARGET